jgi:hypothetical protein
VIDRSPVDHRGVPSAGGNPPPDRPYGGRGGGFDAAPQFEVRLAEQWVNSNVQVRQGQRVRIEASGQMTLDGRFQSFPEGVSGRRDQDAPMPNENDGALIAAIGTDANSPAILIGRSREFTADRDGILYLTVNHWNTTDARGAYQVRISTERVSGSSNTSGSNTSTPPTNQNRDWRERNVTISANRSWTDTGIDLEPGMTVEITSAGQIAVSNSRRVDANGDTSQRNTSYLPAPNAGLGALIARIRYRQGGDSNIVFVGTTQTLTVDQGEFGRLWLGINDDYTGDNSGAFSVRIRYAK